MSTAQQTPQNFWELPERTQEKVTTHRLLRIKAIEQGETPVPTGEEWPKLILHVFPLCPWPPHPVLSVQALSGKTPKLPTFRELTTHTRINVDGSLVYGDSAYCQIHKDGVVEAVSTELIKEDKGKKYIIGNLLKSTIENSFRNYLDILKNLDVPCPLGLSVVMTKVKGSFLKIDNHFDQDEIDREPLFLPIVMVNQYPAPEETILALWPILDALWNAGGFKRCEHP